MAEWVSFTGTRHLSYQDVVSNGRLDRIVDELPDDAIVVTGGCLGVDSFVAHRAYLRGLFVVTILPANRSQVDTCWDAHCDLYEEMPEGTSYRDRNVRLITAGDRAIAIPEYPEDHPRSDRSGTWQAVRIARRQNKPVEIHILRGA